jgi:hypothetical protein
MCPPRLPFLSWTTIGLILVGGLTALWCLEYRRRRGTLSASYSALLTATFAITLCTLGPYARSAFVEAFETLFLGTLNVRDRLSSAYPISSALAVAGIPGGLLVSIVVSSIASFRRQVVFAFVVSAIVFSLVDMWVWYCRLADFPDLVLDLFTNALGGMIVGSAVAAIHSSLKTPIRATPRVAVTLVMRFASVLGVAAIFGIVIYVLFFYRVHSRVHLTLSDWDGLVLRYAQRMTADVQGRRLVPVSTRAERIIADASGGSLEIEWANARENEKGDTSVTVATLSTAPDLSEESLTTVGRMRWGGLLPIIDSQLLYVGRMNPGRLVATGRAVQLTFDVGTDTEVLIMFPGEKRIWFARGPQEFPRMAESTFTSMKPLRMSTEQTGFFQLRLFGRSTVALMFESRPPNAVEPFSLMLPDSLSLNIPRGREGRYPPVLVLMGGWAGQRRIDVVTPVRGILFARPTVDLSGRGATTTIIGDVYVRAPKGRLQLDDAGISLDRADELYIGGESLTVRGSTGGDTLIQGLSREVAVNRILRSRSTWTSIPVDFRSAFVAAVVSGILSLRWKRLRRTWRKWR